MKLELKDNKVFFENKGHKKEIHPFWLRERVNGENFVDKSTQQRLFDPTQLPENIQIKDLSLNSNFLEIKFNDGASTKIAVVDIFKEFSNINDVKQIDNELFSARTADAQNEVPLTMRYASSVLRSYSSSVVNEPGASATHTNE